MEGGSELVRRFGDKKLCVRKHGGPVVDSNARQWLAALGTPQQVALRCRMVLASGHGESEGSIAAKLDVNRKTVRLWRERFLQEGLEGLWEIAPGRGRKATLQRGPR